MRKGRLLRGEKPIERGEGARDAEALNIRYARIIRAELADYIRRAREQGRDMTSAELYQATRHPTVRLCDAHYRPDDCPAERDGNEAQSGTALPE